jgi:hypothetical protein
LDFAGPIDSGSIPVDPALVTLPGKNQAIVENLSREDLFTLQIAASFDFIMEDRARFLGRGWDRNRILLSMALSGKEDTPRE